MAGEQLNMYMIRRPIPKYRNIEFLFEASFYLQQIHYTASVNLDLRFLHVPRNMFSLEEIINAEMMAHKARYMHEENFFVGQMLMREPVTFGRRPREMNRTDMTPMQLIKAESCRRSRFNGKIRKAVTRHRHQFITMSLRKSALLLRYLHDHIGIVEYKLVQAGYDPNYFLTMRFALGLNQNIDDLLAIPETMR